MKMGVGVVRARCGLRVILDSEYRKCFVAKAFHRSVVQIEVGDLQLGRTGDPFGRSLNCKAVVLRGDQYPPRCQILDRVIPASVPIRHLRGLPAESQSEKLMTQTDPEGRVSGLRQFS